MERFEKVSYFSPNPIVNVDRWAWARRLWVWHNEYIVDCLADASRRKGRKRTQRGRWN